ncbi:CopG family transcriptional regulator [Psychrobacter sp. I-STPA10]|uniref:CopG family transcriptional regulator n=1 Tax=Psychrobacter sp. I-STPA10 TaxID=2585769 RepID=UPI001E566E27|nr:CopG family transcriptional regulator [Psychrobacter sp. I-STPA10]
MLPPHIKNKFSNHPQQISRPISIRLSEDLIAMLETTSQEFGFQRIQGLIRLYIRQGLDRDNDKYTLAHDEVFLETLRQKGVSQKVIDEAIADASGECPNTPLSGEL